VVQGLLIVADSFTLKCTTFGWTPLDECSALQRPLPDDTTLTTPMSQRDSNPLSQQAAARLRLRVRQYINPVKIFLHYLQPPTPTLTCRSSLLTIIHINITVIQMLLHKKVLNTNLACFIHLKIFQQVQYQTNKNLWTCLYHKHNCIYAFVAKFGCMHQNVSVICTDTVCH